MDAVGGFDERPADRIGDVLLDRRARPLGVDRHRAAAQRLAIEEAEHDVCVRHRRVLAAAA